MWIHAWYNIFVLCLGSLNEISILNVPFKLIVMGDDLSILPNLANSRRQLRKVKRIFVHPRHDPSLRDDIAVLIVCLFVFAIAIEIQ